MSKGLTRTSAIIISIAASTPALATNYHDYHAWSHPNDSALVSHHPGYAGPVYDAHPVHDKCWSDSDAVCATHRRGLKVVHDRGHVSR
jgi:hypothetical protein